MKNSLVTVGLTRDERHSIFVKSQNATKTLLANYTQRALTEKHQKPNNVLLQPLLQTETPFVFNPRDILDIR